MERIVGKKNIFAIQYEITEIDKQYIYGYICYWINGKQLGDYNTPTIINDVLLFLPRIIKDNGKREHKKFYQMKKEEVVYLLGGQAYLDDEKYEKLALEETWERFQVMLGLDVFSNTFVNVIDSEQKTRIIFGDDTNVEECFLQKGVVDEVFMTLYTELDTLEREKLGVY